MSDGSSFTLAQLCDRVRQFVRERDWEQFHSPKNLSMSISIEAAELMECFQWEPENQVLSSSESQHVKDEMADVLIYCLALANALDIDASQAVVEKLERSGMKYPAELFKGRFK